MLLPERRHHHANIQRKSNQRLTEAPIQPKHNRHHSDVNTQRYNAFRFYNLPHELGQTNPEYYYTFQGAEWCQLFCRWLLLHAGMPLSAVPDESNTLEALAWYCQHADFWFKGQEHKTRCKSNHAGIRERTAPDLMPEESAYLPRVGDFIVVVVVVVVGKYASPTPPRPPERGSLACPAAWRRRRSGGCRQ